ncbi:KAP family NTPase [Aliarcobacter butzleri]|uniref:KAP family NTPase n=1 Tax=Aliarcobacter butzleri TaxID=28197 RepID=UPI0021B491B3|nr:KAP family NTPase [Aliarcobacter butzleri]MCT7633759.1 KAP family NTPase [Aliarcobacter butzleri]
MFLKNLYVFILAIFLITGILFPLYIILKNIFSFYLEIEIFCLTLIFLFLTFLILYFLCKEEKDYETIKKKDEPLLLDDDIYKELKKEEVVIVKNIIETYSNNSFFSLAIIGPWGIGKSSFLFNLKENIKNDKVIYLNVWELENIENIIQEIEKEFDNIIFEFNLNGWFFYHIKSIFIRNYFSTLSKYLSEDGIKINLSFTQTIQKSKENYNKLLRESLKDKKIIIMIDEIDRLEDKQDILNIFKAIRYLSSFDKIFTITTLDINKIKEKVGLDYTHKIFNSKHMLSKTSKTDLYNFLKDTISTKLSKSDFINKNDFIEFLNKYVYINKNLIDYINTYREIKNCYNDTYILCKSLENENQQEWKKHISFEFIFTLNLIKALNFDFYLKLMNEQEFMNLLIRDLPVGRIINETNQKNESYKNKFEEFIKFREINQLCLILEKYIKEIDKLIYIFEHHQIYDYMFTESKYLEFKKNNNNEIYTKYNELQNKNKESFINELINKVQEEEDPADRDNILKKIFKTIGKEKFLILIKHNLTNYKHKSYSTFVLREMFELYFNNKKTDTDLLNLSFNLLEITSKFPDKDLKYDLYKTMYGFFKNTEFKSKFKKSLFDFQGLTKENYIQESIDLINFLDEKIENFFEDDEDYIIYNDEKRDFHNYYKGKKIKESCNKHLIQNPSLNVECQVLIKESDYY